MAKRVVPTSGHHAYESTEALAKSAPIGEGVHTIMHRDVPIDIRFDDRKAPTTIVFFHAAITKAVASYPVFSGGTFSEGIHANRLFVSDPSLYVDSRLRLAWYAGSSTQPDLQEVLEAVIRAAVPEGSRVVFFGASGGGFASLYFSSKFAGSVAVPVNPQTTLRAYNPVITQRYLNYAWGGLALEKLPVTTDLIDLYSEPRQNEVLYVQNTGDADHMENHYRPFLEALPSGHTVRSRLVDAGEGHVPPSRAMLGEILGEVVESLS